MSTVWGSGDFEVLSATLIKPRPLSRTFLPLESGLSVLYGRNGAGKSRILEGLQAAVSGSQGRAWAWLHVRMRRGLPPDAEDLTSQLIRMLRSEPSIYMPAPPAAGDDIRLVELVAAALRNTWEDFVADAAALAEEVARAGVLTLIPVGGLDEHRWRVYASALPGDDTPLLSERAVRYRAEWSAALAVPEGPQREQALFDAKDAFGLEEEPEVDETEPPPFSEPERPQLLVEIGQLTLEAGLCDLYGLPSADLNADTLQRLLHVDGKRQPMLEAGTDQLDVRVVEDLEHLSSRASELYDLVLERAPRLVCKIAPVEEWLTAPALSWVADDPDGPAALPLSELSQAQKRWAEIAIAATLIEYERAGPRALMLLDEPELALHSLAVRTMAAGLQQLATTINVDIFAATHSAALLEATNVHLLHVSRSGGDATEVHRMAGVHESTAERLGMTKAELLQLTRVFVVVEGLHDQIVLDETCRDDLGAARAHLIPLRGARNAASLVDAQFLLHFTDAAFLVVIDAVPPGEATAAWQTAREAWRATRDAGAVEKALKENLPGGKGSEYKFLRELMTSAIAEGHEHRLHFRTLPEPDVVYYLPISAFTSKPVSWQSLAGEHAASGTTLSFKGWLMKQQGFSFDPEQMRKAARSLDSLHADIVALTAELHALAQGPPAA